MEDISVTNYNVVLSEVLEKHAPLVSKYVKVSPDIPWLDSEFFSLRRKRRKAEKTWLKSGSSLDRELYVQLRNEVSCLVRGKKKTYLKRFIANNSSNNKALFSFCHSLLDSSKTKIHPQYENPKALANEYNVFFTEKVKSIRSGITDTQGKCAFPVSAFSGVPLSTFQPTTALDLFDIIKGSNCKTSPADPLPACLLRDC